MAEEIKVEGEGIVEASDKPESSTEKVEEVNSLEAIQTPSGEQVEDVNSSEAVQTPSGEQVEETTPSETEENGDQKTPAKKADSLESALRKFKRQSSGIISEVRKREAYDKPSVKRKKKSKAARRHKKNNRFNGNRW